MIAAFMMYAIAIASLVTLAAIAIEYLFVVRGWTRRAIWVVAMMMSIGLPTLALMAPSSLAYEPLAAIAPITVPQSVDPHSESNRTFRSESFATAFEWPTFPVLDSGLKYGWLALSIGLLSMYLAGWIQLLRFLRAWPTEVIRGRTVFVSGDVGPAVIGFVKPKVIMPRWLLSASEGTRASAMAHEEEHINAHDPLCHLLALTLVAIMPWNPVLWWQLRRLRFAIEVDCDARVIRGDVDVLVYSETLLAVGQRRVRTFAAAMTMTEPVTQLERRIDIMTTQVRRYSLFALCAAIGISIACIAAAAELRAPNPAPLRLAQASSTTRSSVLNKKLDISLKDADLREIILALERVYGRKVYINSAVGGKISLELNGISRQEAVDTILRTRNLIRRQDGDTIYIDPSPTPAIPVKTSYTGERLNLYFSNVSIRSILRTLSDVSHQNMLVAKDVEFTTSVDLKDTPWDEALDIILKSNNLTSRRAGNLIIVESSAPTVQ